MNMFMFMQHALGGGPRAFPFGRQADVAAGALDDGRAKFLFQCPQGVRGRLPHDRVRCFSKS